MIIKNLEKLLTFKIAWNRHHLQYSKTNLQFAAYRSRVSVLDLSLTDVRLGWSDCWQGGQRGGWTARRADKRAIVPLVKVKVAKGALRSREARTAPAKRGFRLRFLGRVSGARRQNAN